MYERYYYSKIVDQGLKGKEYRDENWDSYMFRIINIFNKNTDLNALACLQDVYKMINLEKINRLKSTRDSLKLSIKIYKFINTHFSVQKREDSKHQAQQNRANAKKNKTLCDYLPESQLKNSFFEEPNYYIYFLTTLS